MKSEEIILNELMDDLENDRLTLPTLPEVALQIRDEINGDNISTTHISNIVTRDASLSVKLLQIANSPLYRARNPIDNIKTAISRLGFSQIRNLVSSLVMKQMFQSINQVLDHKLHYCWNHSVQVAAIASVIAAQHSQLEKDQAILAGLVHDIGKLPILVRAGSIPELMNDEAVLDRLLEKLHSTVGEKILQKWDFPEFIINCATLHENIDYDHDGPADYVDLTIAANIQSHVGTDQLNKFPDWSAIPAFKRLGISTDTNSQDDQKQTQIQEIKQIFTAS